ncbi:hypothetical protein AAE250_14145 [Bacteroides sp. GD17]|jgi:hypothetical protein|uniref:hypothetical protein n=1 Tax=Bacteroides sp. GD17 TaxID=3139826 RepID=UPI00260156FD|nr:hypothetical protein [uncultured Bacteroides sp.]
MKKRFFLIPLFWILAVAGFGAAIMLLWNAVMPAILGAACISFWQALALFVLARLLFGNFPFPGGRGRRMPRSGRTGNPFREKWEKMSPEERKNFISRRRNFGFGGPFDREDFFSRGGFDNQTERSGESEKAQRTEKPKGSEKPKEDE